MSYSIAIVHSANIHLTKAIDWCIEQNPGLEIKLLKSVDAAISYIQKNPLKSQIRYLDVRIKFLRNPKFGIHYVIRDKHIFIVGIFHTSQDSDNWK
jgi:hypothetical protein